MQYLARTDHKMQNHIQILHMSTTQNIHDSYRWSGSVKKQRKNEYQVTIRTTMLDSNIRKGGEIILYLNIPHREVHCLPLQNVA